MPRHRGVLTLAILAALVVAGLAAWNYTPGPLPPPAKADQRALLRWLVCDLARETPDVQLELVNRLQQELLADGLADLPVESAASHLSKSQITRLAENGQLLKRVWFHARVEEYASCSVAERTAFLEHQIATLFRWLEIDSRLFSAGREAGLVTSPLTVGEFFTEVDDWMATSQGLAHERMVQGVRDAVLRWLATRSLVGQPRETIRELALHIAAQLAAGAPASGAGFELAEGEQRLLESNGQMLLEAWFRAQAQRYEALPEPQRATFVSEQINFLKRSGVAEMLQGQTPGHAATTLGSAATALRFLGWANGWIERSPPEEKPSMGNFLGAVQAELLARQMRELFPWPGARKEN